MPPQSVPPYLLPTDPTNPDPILTAESFSVDYGETVAADDFWYSYSGFVNGEDEDVLTELPVIECEAASMLEAGEYPITVSGGEALNYEFKYEQGTLTVLQIPQALLSTVLY